jgi:spore germination cell wall hydrolase CwlJ-like protein
VAAFLAPGLGLMDAAIVVTPEDLDDAGYTLFGECRGEPENGQLAVAWVIRTRATWSPPTWWGKTVSEVCLAPEQFSCWNKTDPNYALLQGLPFNNLEFQTLRTLAETVFAGTMSDPAVDSQGNHPTHYQRIGTNAPWSVGKTPSATIGHQEFYVIGPG